MRRLRRADASGVGPSFRKRLLRRRPAGVYQGTVNSSLARRRGLSSCRQPHRPAIDVVHNHPSGDPTPSAEDIRTTEQLRKAGELLDIELLDHIIVGQQRFVSLKERGLGF
jgi:DNA repair protein RadC